VGTTGRVMQSDSAVGPRPQGGPPDADHVDVWGGWAGLPPDVPLTSGMPQGVEQSKATGRC